MLEEQEMLNLWLTSGEPYFLQKSGIDRSYFFALREVVEWVEEFRDKTGEKLPSRDTVALQFEHFRKIDEIDPLVHVVQKLKEQKAYMEYRPILMANAELVSEGKTLEALLAMKSNIDNLIVKYDNKMTYYDWVKNAEDRYKKYMELHGQEGLRGLTTGINAFDEVTGGWVDDDFVVISARLGEGKSLLAIYFAYSAWRSLSTDGIDSPVIYVSTEMPKDEVAFRLDTMRSHFSNKALNEGMLDSPELYLEYLQGLSEKHPSFIILSQAENQGKEFTPYDIQRLIELERPALVVVDQLYDFADGSGERDIRKRIVNVTRQLRSINEYTKTPLIAVAQAGRNAGREQKKNRDAMPELEDIQESDYPAQKATKVITLRQLDNVFRLTLKKNRHGKRDVSFYLHSDIDKGIYEEISDYEQVF